LGEPFSKGFCYVLRRFSYDEQLHKVDEGGIDSEFRSHDFGPVDHLFR